MLQIADNTSFIVVKGLPGRKPVCVQMDYVEEVSQGLSKSVAERLVLLANIVKSL